jgi:hypothetical protein
MVRLVRGRPLLHIFMVKSNEAVNKSAPRSVELFTIRTKKNASVELALRGLLNNSRLPISAVVLHRFWKAMNFVSRLPASVRLNSSAEPLR